MASILLLLYMHGRTTTHKTWSVLLQFFSPLTPPNFGLNTRNLWNELWSEGTRIYLVILRMKSSWSWLLCWAEMAREMAEKWRKRTEFGWSLGIYIFCVTRLGSTPRRRVPGACNVLAEGSREKHASLARLPGVFQGVDPSVPLHSWLILSIKSRV
jgi:hypothetical protein